MVLEAAARRVVAVTGSRIQEAAEHSRKHPDIRYRARRMTRKLVQAHLEADGWALLHAAAIVHDGKAILVLGCPGAGKTVTARCCSPPPGINCWRTSGSSWTRPPAVLPWPSVAAVGLGLLHAHGLLDGVRARPARSGTATALLFPRVDPDGPPRIGPRPRPVTSQDFADPGGDEHCPDFLRPARITPQRRYRIWNCTRDALATLPHHGLVLTRGATNWSASRW
jgi:hypothetical protein